MDNLKSSSIRAHQIWVASGKPVSGDLASKMKQARNEYKAAIAEKRALANKAFSDDINDALLDRDMGSFWSIWNSKFEKGRVSPMIDGQTNAHDIANAFAEFFKTACSPNNIDLHSKHKDQFINVYDKYVSCSEMSSTDLLVSVENVELAISETKKGKAAGADGIMIEHITYSHPCIILCLAKLFSLCLIHGYVPDQFGAGIMIPLMKGSDVDASCSSNYRGLTLSPVFSKIFERILLMKFGRFLQTSDLQFGFKKGVGTSDALFTFRNAVNFLNGNGSTVSIALLDISKAFDKISHYMLYLKLLRRNVPRSFIDILCCWYKKCLVSVRWNNVFSPAFQLHAGVRQGGVLSPMLFAVYIDDIISELSIRGLGFSLHGCFIGCLLYADDMLLISHSYSMLQIMLDVCCTVMYSLDLKFNVKKSVLLRIGSRFNSLCTPLKLDGQVLTSVTECKYLGAHILAGKHFKCSYAHIKLKFYRLFNAIYSKSSAASAESISVQLLKSYCAPVVYYACEALSYSCSDTSMFNRLFNRALAKIFKTFDADVISDIRGYFMIDDAKAVIGTRVSNFEKKFWAKSLYFNRALFACGLYYSYARSDIVF